MKFMHQARWMAGLALLIVAPFGLSIHADETGIDVLPDKTYVHTATKLSLRFPKNWEKIHEPYKLRRTGTTSVLGVEMRDPRIVVTIYFTPMGSRDMKEIVHATDKAAERGEEYQLLTTVYGAANIEPPIVTTIGNFKVYKIAVNAGPDKDEQGAGVVYLFEVGSGDNRWRVKIRGVYPVTGKEAHMKTVENLITLFKPYVE